MSTTAKTFQFQESIPRLPIPSLEETKARYLRSMLPILTPEEYKQHEHQANDFFDKLGPTLQKRLIAYEKNEKHSWLENIWFKKAYLEYRDPVLINVNWFMALKTPMHLTIDENAKPYNEKQLSRAANIIRYSLEFNRLLNEEKVPVEYSKESPLCMNQYKCMFGTSRVPIKPCDQLLFQYPTKHSHIIVLVNDQIFKVEVMKDGAIYSNSQILYLLQSCVNQALQIKDPSPPIGILTGEHRDVWSDAYAKLLPKYKNNLDIINTALFAMSLDAKSPERGVDPFARMVFHNGNGRNRWFDKALSFNVFPDGQAGLNGEHSPLDAVVAGRTLDYVLEREYAEKITGVESSKVNTTPVHLKFGGEVNEEIEKAKISVQKMIDDNETCVLYSEVVGVSPDGFVQMAMQLAFYKMHKYSPATYESAAIRKFKHGRTECVRVCSVETVKFVKTWTSNSTDEEKIGSLKEALNSHNSYMKAASQAKGVDRHILGLRCMMDGPHPFVGELYYKGVNFELSTSNMSPGKYQAALGFGPVVDTGYGINYASDKHMTKFSIGSKKSCKATDSFAFRYILDQTINGMVSFLEGLKTSKL